MSFLLKKSQGNLQAASAMVNNALLCHASVHCSYYGCIQLIKHVLTHVVKPPIELPKKEIHQVAKKVMLHQLYEKADRDSALYFNNKFGELQEYRVDSDYLDVSITEEKAKKAYQIADKIYRDIKDNFVEE